MSAVTAARARLLGLDGAPVARITIIIDDDLPAIVLRNGEPYLLIRDGRGGADYQQQVPFRVLGDDA